MNLYGKIQEVIPTNTKLKSISGLVSFGNSIVTGTFYRQPM